MVVQVQMDAIDAPAAFRAAGAKGEIAQESRAARPLGEGFDRYVVAVLVLAQAVWVGALAYLVVLAV